LHFLLVQQRHGQGLYQNLHLVAIDEATIEEKDLAWMPATNDVNKGALGQFHVMICCQPQLTLLGHNAIAMYFCNDTEAFIKEKFTEKEDHQFLHKLARKSTGEEKKWKKEIVDFGKGSR